MESQEELKTQNDDQEKQALKIKRVPLSDWKVRYDYRYEFLQKVGVGAYGEVYKAKLKQQYCQSEEEEKEFYALKKLIMAKSDEGFPITSLREIQYLKKLKHTNIVNLKDVVVSLQEGDSRETRPDVFLVFEYMEYDINGLFNKKVEFTVPHIKCILKQLLQAVQYLHKNNVMHRDIKSANILMNNEGILKLADFGLAKQYDQFRKAYTNKVVTLWYRAPELLLGSYQYDKSIDIWSVGCFFAELFLGKPLFPGDIEAKQIDLIFQMCGTPDYDSWPNLMYLTAFAELKPKEYPDKLVSHFKNLPMYPDRIDDQMIDLLKGMLTLNPEKRLTVEQCLSHSYFTTDPLPCEKSELPKVEGEAHEHALREERRRESLEASHQARMQASQYRGGYSNRGHRGRGRGHYHKRY